MKDTRSLYEKKVRDLVSLLESAGEKIEPTESDALVRCKQTLAPYLLPEELIILYQYIKESKNLSFPWLNDTDQALKYRNIVKDELPTFLPIGDDWAGGNHFVVLSKVQQVTSPLYYIDLGAGDPGIYLYAYSLNNLLDLEIERLNIFHKTGSYLGYHDLYLKFMPDAYPYPEDPIGQNGYYSKNGIRNLYDSNEKEDLPKEWIE